MDEHIDDLIALAKAVQRNYEATETDDWQEQHEASQEMFDAYMRFSAWGHDLSVEEITALLEQSSANPA